VRSPSPEIIAQLRRDEKDEEMDRGARSKKEKKKESSAYVIHFKLGFLKSETLKIFFSLEV